MSAQHLWDGHDPRASQGIRFQDMSHQRSSAGHLKWCSYTGMILAVDLTYISRAQTVTVQEEESPKGVRAPPSLSAPFLLADDCCACLVQYSEAQSRFCRSCQLLALIFRALSAVAKRSVSCCVQTYMLVLLVLVDVGVQILPSCIGSHLIVPAVSQAQRQTCVYKSLLPFFLIFHPGTGGSYLGQWCFNHFCNQHLQVISCSVRSARNMSAMNSKNMNG